MKYKEALEIVNDNINLIGKKTNLGLIDEIVIYPTDENLKEEFKRVHKIVKRNDEDKVHRGNSWVLNELILKIKKSDYFIELISHYFVDGRHIELQNTHSIEIVDKCLLYISEEDDFLLRFLTAINGKTHYFRHERLLAEIIADNDNRLKATQ